ncbi:PREDICTED: bifunctional transcriptional activator/DNA repair enzyme Ada [Polistes canadensis]|uniref:bifunctional transcriptional activator/DNA repair enzyme Ada n=1 Tax=Polistes canadensis TaxID=91411 RepID=UPI000718AD09|nr:PREDICTED: bifunctional transcriptional activator/DNA repair enzyme Ada [Polistes canadensis]
MITFQTMSSETYKVNHEKFIIYYDFYDTPFGRCIIGLTDTDKAILHFAFVVKDDADAMKDLENEWPLSQIVQDSTEMISNIMKDVFALKCDGKDTKSILVLLKGTTFQIEVWKALVSIPIGKTASYEEVAHMINNPKAVRAVANAIGKNRVAYLIPCHRVMGKNGSNKYSCGLKYKQSILLYESKLL